MGEGIESRRDCSTVASTGMGGGFVFHSHYDVYGN